VDDRKVKRVFPLFCRSKDSDQEFKKASALRTLGCSMGMLMRLRLVPDIEITVVLQERAVHDVIVVFNNRVLVQGGNSTACRLAIFSLWNRQASPCWA